VVYVVGNGSVILRRRPLAAAAASDLAARSRRLRAIDALLNGLWRKSAGLRLGVQATSK